MALRVWLPFNGNLNNQGLSSATITGTSSYKSDGKIGPYALNGGTIQIKVPEIEDTKICTFAFWAYVTSSLITSNWTQVARFNDKGTNAGSNMRFEVCPSSYQNGIYCFSNHNNPNHGLTTGVIASPAGGYYDQWVHFCFTSDGTTFTRYMNGIKIGTCTYNGEAVLSGDFFLVNNDKCFKQDVRVYDECLSPKQVKEISKGLVAHYKLDAPKANENFILRSDTITSGSQASGITRTYMNDGSMKIVSTSGNGNYASIGFAENSNTNVGNKLSVGDTYTISCDIKIEEGTVFPTLFINSGNSYKQLGGVTLKLNTWQRIYYTSTWNDPGTGYGNIALHLGFSGAIGTYYFKNFKLEKGNFTPWIPAPTDPMYTLRGYDRDVCTDCSGNLYNLTKAGTETFNFDSARYSGSTKFGGTCADYLYRDRFTWLTSPFTFNCWIYQTSATSTSGSNTGNTLQFIMSQGRDCGYAGFALCSANGYARLYLGTATSGTYYTMNDNTVNLLNGWHMLTGTFDGTTAKLYVDGVQKVTQASAVNPSWEQTTCFALGKMSYNATSSTTTYFPFVGSISDAKIYATALSADDILTTYKNSGIIDNKGNVYAYEFKEE